MVRGRLYHSDEERKEAHRLASLRSLHKKKAIARGEEIPEKPIPKSMTREYHQQRYQAKKLAKLNKLTSDDPSLSLQDKVYQSPH
jgi:hypothetical protein